VILIQGLTMMSTRIPSVNDTYFQHKVLTKVHGQPTYETLQTLATELKANAGSVPSTIGGGKYGHLGLLLSAARYATLAHTVPWTQPSNPGPFVPPVGRTAAQIDAARDVRRELKHSFELCQATEKALVAQIVDTIDPIYLRPLLNRATGQYATSIRAVVTHLFTTHGTITPQQVKAKEQAVFNMHYDISQPVDIVFNSIEDLADLPEHANSPMSAQQQIDLAYVIFARQPILQQDMRSWHRSPVADCTWANMLAHFRDAQADLSSLPTAADAYHQQPPHQANSVAAMAELVATPSRYYARRRTSRRSSPTNCPGELYPRKSNRPPGSRVCHADPNAGNDGNDAQHFHFHFHFHHQQLQPHFVVQSWWMRSSH
jgi:hypothetical protein